MATTATYYLDPHPVVWRAAVEKALGPQVDKVRAIFAQGYGWEVWAQVEISLAVELMARNDTLYGSHNLEFQREEEVYESATFGVANRQRCDLRVTLWSTTITHLPWQYFVELKCLSGAGLTYFIGEIRKDIDKVRAAKRPTKKWAKNPWYTAAEVLGITVNPLMTGKVASDIEEFEKEYRILDNDYAVRARKTLQKLQRGGLTTPQLVRQDEQKALEALQKEMEIFDRMMSLGEEKEVRWTTYHIGSDRSVMVWAWERVFVVEGKEI